MAPGGRKRLLNNNLINIYFCPAGDYSRPGFFNFCSMLNRFVFLFVVVLLSSSAQGQLVVLDPPNATGEDSVLVIFDASKGDAGLMGYTGDVWAHTGVGTSAGNWRYVIADWNQNTDKAKLNFLGNNLWEFRIDPSIRDFYGVPDSEIITQLSFVFRNHNGSESGRDVGGGDIFIELAQLNVEIIQPQEDWFIASAGQRITIEARATLADSIFMYHDGDLVAQTAGNDFYYEISAQDGRVHYVEVKANNSQNSVSDNFSYAVRETYELPDGVRDGINYLDENTVVLVLYAPAKDSINVIGDFNGWDAAEDNLMKNTPDGKRFWLQINNLEAGREYLFQYLVDGDFQMADPYTEKTSDYNDQFINNETYPDLIRYPSNEAEGAVSIIQTAQVPYEWKIHDFERPDKTNMVIYELLMRDFSDSHTFSTMIDTLDYFQKLGVNAIELMPVSEFEGNVSWGYNPSFYFAPDKFYGPKDSYKAFIDACHERGIAVIMDMVLNHSYGRNPMVKMYWDEENNRPAENNPWFNTVSPNPVYSWGYDFDHESEATMAFVDSVNRFWIQEYHIDGYRFDFTKGFTNTPGDGGGNDPARIAILKRMADRIWELDSDVYIILEHFSGFEEEKALIDYGMLYWGNVNYSYRKAGAGWFMSNDATNLARASYQFNNLPKPHLVSYMESHDEERLMYETYVWGNTKNSEYSLKDTTNGLKRMELSANFFIPIPGPKMIWMFGELGYDYSINFNGRVGRKPIRWDYYDDPRRQRLYKIYSALNHLKSDYEVFKTTDFQITLNDTLKRIHLNHPEMNVSILGNYGIWPTTGNPNFQHSGWWYEYWSGDSLYVENPYSEMTFLPGEYRLYTDVKLEQPDISTGIDEIIAENSQEMEFLVYPNPVTDRLLIANISEMYEDVEIDILDVSGRLVLTRKIPHWASGQTKQIDTSDLTHGVYFLRVVSNKAVELVRFVK